MEEAALYTVKDGKIMKEEFFYQWGMSESMVHARGGAARLCAGQDGSFNAYIGQAQSPAAPAGGGFFSFIPCSPAPQHPLRAPSPSAIAANPPRSSPRAGTSTAPVLAPGKNPAALRG